MNPTRPLRALWALALIAGIAPAGAAELAVSHATMQRLAMLRNGDSFSLQAFPTGTAHVAAMHFERVQLYSDDAHIYLVDARGTTEVPRSKLVFLRGTADEGSARVALALNPDGSFAGGDGAGPEGSFSLSSAGNSSGTKSLIAHPLDSALPAGFKFNFQCGNETEPMDVHSADSIAKQLAMVRPENAASIAATSHALRFATVAVDTDTLFMSKLFSGGGPSAATDWIAKMFNSMNTMYERDLLVRLYQGTTFLRVSPAPDPYTSVSDVPADRNDLNIFAAYWKANNSAVARAFAILLSGQETSTANSCSASGIAWINQYCGKGTTQGSDTVGSYSVNQVCTALAVDPNATFDARIVGHEIGHNFGALHTHCTDVTSGAQASTNTIDQCFSGESGCYSGPTSCPVAGSAPGAPAGTIMSYCNLRAPQGCGSDHQNVLQFHPTQVSKTLLPDILAAGSCLNTTDDIFFNLFE